MVINEAVALGAVVSASTSISPRMRTMLCHYQGDATSPLSNCFIRSDTVTERIQLNSTRWWTQGALLKTGSQASENQTAVGNSKLPAIDAEQA